MRRITLRLAIALITFMLGISATGGLRFLAKRLTSDKEALSSKQEPKLIAAATSASLDEQDILEIERQYAIAQTQLDAAFFERIEADSFTLTTSNGRTLTKAEDIALFKTWDGKTKFSNDDLHVQLYGDAAIVTGRITATNIEYGYSSQCSWIDLFVKRNGRWQILSTVQVNR